jgi:hypothetical protein
MSYARAAAARALGTGLQENVAGAMLQKLADQRARERTQAGDDYRRRLIELQERELAQQDRHFGTAQDNEMTRAGFQWVDDPAAPIERPAPAASTPPSTPAPTPPPAPSVGTALLQAIRPPQVPSRTAPTPPRTGPSRANAAPRYTSGPTPADTLAEMWERAPGPTPPTTPATTPANVPRPAPRPPAPPTVATAPQRRESSERQAGPIGRAFEFFFDPGRTGWMEQRGAPAGVEAGQVAQAIRARYESESAQAMRLPTAAERMEAGQALRARYNAETRTALIPHVLNHPELSDEQKRELLRRLDSGGLNAAGAVAEALEWPKGNDGYGRSWRKHLWGDERPFFDWFGRPDDRAQGRSGRR